ncbi:MAG: aminotransferase class III-fold pyridoxal phosphate-dependent enzyme [Candidatus Hadarchaeaceae archaeon]
MKRSKKRFAKSFEYWSKAEKLIPAGTQTLSKGPDQFVKGAYPVYLKSGKGSHVFDVDGNEYIDYPLALGSVILGYRYPRVNEAIVKQLKEGIVFSLMHPLEVEVSELLTEVIPCAEMVRFGKNGADATSAAVRVARAYTGREKIAYCGYHGWQDWYIVTTSRDKGVPNALRNYICPFEFNKIETLDKVFEENKGEVAAIIMEPMGVEEPRNGFLGKVKELAHENDALLIFDEIVTGFRLAMGGAQEYFKVTPDLACFGKGMANGMPLSAVVGRKEVMKLFDEVFFSVTFGGEALSLAAALATIREIKEKNVIKHIWEKGSKLQKGYNKLAEEIGVNTRSIGFPPRMIFTFKDQGSDSLEMKSLFFQEAVKRGVLFGNVTFISYSHTDDDIQKSLEVCGDVLKILKKAVDENKVKKLLEGEVAKEVFRKVMA